MACPSATSTGTGLAGWMWKSNPNGGAAPVLMQPGSYSGNRDRDKPEKCRVGQLEIMTMRKVTEQIVNAFYEGRKLTVGNTSTDGMEIRLHGNRIAYKANGSIRITNCGWFTSTTKERLNGLDGVNIQQKNGEWFLNGEPWNGNEAKIEL